MKTWQAVLVQMLLAAVSAAIPQLQGVMAKTAAGAAIGGAVVAAAKKTSQSNPDGTPAEVAYVPPQESK